ncbi:MAG: hypothetical protein R2748_01615 [Bryobacterales bacterium]
MIDRSLASLQSSLTEQFAIVGVVCLIFLFHVRSGIVAIITLPVGVLMAFLAMYFQGTDRASCRWAALRSRSARWSTRAS